MKRIIYIALFFLNLIGVMALLKLSGFTPADLSLWSVELKKMFGEWWEVIVMVSQSAIIASFFSNKKGREAAAEIATSLKPKKPNDEE